MNIGFYLTTFKMDISNGFIEANNIPNFSAVNLIGTISPFLNSGVVKIQFKGPLNATEVMELAGDGNYTGLPL